MLITTMNDVPGHEITDVYGEVLSAIYEAHRRGLSGTPAGWTAVA